MFKINVKKQPKKVPNGINFESFFDNFLRAFWCFLGVWEGDLEKTPKKEPKILTFWWILVLFGGPKWMKNHVCLETRFFCEKA